MKKCLRNCKFFTVIMHYPQHNQIIVKTALDCKAHLVFLRSMDKFSDTYCTYCNAEPDPRPHWAPMDPDQRGYKFLKR